MALVQSVIAEMIEFFILNYSDKICLMVDVIDINIICNVLCEERFCRFLVFVEVFAGRVFVDEFSVSHKAIRTVKAFLYAILCFVI